MNSEDLELLERLERVSMDFYTMLEFRLSRSTCDCMFEQRTCDGHKLLSEAADVLDRLDKINKHFDK